MSVKVHDLHFDYADRPVLHGVSFDVGAGELASVIGPNGAGKSTLFKCMLGLHHGRRGQVLLDGEDVRHMGARALARRIAYIPQSNYPAFNYPVIDMVLMGASARARAFSAPGRKERAVALDALDALGLADFAQRDYLHLSGGERQLVLIARALAQQSRILVLDEPTANLDYANQIGVMGHMKRLAKRGYTVIQSTHNPEQAYMFSDRLIALQSGKVVAQGAPRAVLDSGLLWSLYGMNVQVESLRGDAIRVCVPCDILDQ